MLETLAYSPHRHALAEESALRDYEIRAQILGRYVALHHIDEANATVRVIGFRHASRLPQADDLPLDVPES